MVSLFNKQETFLFTEIKLDLSENSQLPSARFQAAGAIRDAAIREWGFLEADEKRGLIR